MSSIITRSNLIGYFRSGWAFFIPYLGTYLLYAWLKWPANGFSTAAIGNGGYIPALLHVYWALHAIHAILAALALIQWWKNDKKVIGTTSLLRQEWPTKINRLWPIVPWIMLGLIFAIPGAYLEWPSDPWEHLHRITEWSNHPEISQHSAGYKSFYFFSYSLIGEVPSTAPFARLRLYYTAISLLLSWQYYLLAKATGLKAQWALIFVYVNVLTFGNSCFSFFRYYGLASTIFSQLGAVALIRIALETIKPGNNEHENGNRMHRFFPPRLTFCLPAISGAGFLLLVASAALVALVAFNHVQGIGIAGLGIGAVLVWRLLKWRRKAWICLVVATVLLSWASIAWWPRHPSINAIYEPHNWMSAWYGFNFSWRSPAAERSLQILGAFGIINLVAGVLLLRRNHVIGWLTVGPVMALALPFVALPLANSLAAKAVGEIITFHRMLFAIPSGLALTCCVYQLKMRLDLTKIGVLAHQAIYLAAIAMAGIAVSFPADTPYYNRFWHTLSVTPSDLMPIMTERNSSAVHSWLNENKDSHIVAADSITYALSTLSPSLRTKGNRSIGQPAAKSLDDRVAAILSTLPRSSSHSQTLNADPLGAKRSAWMVVAGPELDFVSNASDSSLSKDALQSQSGQASEIFTSETITINPKNTYVLEISLRQTKSDQGTAYLAVAWYDQNGRALISHLAEPAGAGGPSGWTNGTYSYFGLAGSVAPAKWTNYRIIFGCNATVEIPRYARSIRVGALLNFNSAADAVMQVTNIRLYLRSNDDFRPSGAFTEGIQYFVGVPSHPLLASSASIAGLLSHHWPAQQLASDTAGASELVAAAHLVGATKCKMDELDLYILPPPSNH